MVQHAMSRLSAQASLFHIRLLGMHNEHMTFTSCCVQWTEVWKCSQSSFGKVLLPTKLCTAPGEGEELVLLDGIHHEKGSLPSPAQAPNLLSAAQKSGARCACLVMRPAECVLVEAAICHGEPV